MLQIARAATLLLLLLLFAAPLRAEWQRASSPHFEIYSEGSAADVRARAERLEKFDAVLRRVSGIDPNQESRPLTIFFVEDVDALRRLLGRQFGSAAGVYAPRAAGSLAIVPRETWSDERALSPDAVLFHEYSHHFLLQNFAAAYPPWFVEGFAEFYATATFGADGTVTVGNVPQFRVAGLRAPVDITARDLLTTGALNFRDRALDQFYARSWLLVHFLTFNRERTGQRAHYVAAIEQGVPLEDAARSAFGDLRAFEYELRRYVDSPIASATVAPAALPTPAIEVRPLTRAQVALLPLRMEHMRGIPAERAGAFAAAVRAAAAPYPADPDALFLLAEAEALARNLDASDRAADALLAQVPTHSRALLRKAKNLEARGGLAARAAARPLVVRANRADTRDPLPLVAYYRSFLPDAEPPPPLAVDGLLLAVQLAPQSSDVRLIGGAGLIKAGRLDEAEAVLRPAAYAPHGGGNAATAQELIRLIAASRTGANAELAALADRTLTDLLESF